LSQNKQLSRARAVCIVTYPAATLPLTVERAATSPLRALSYVTLPADMAASSVHAPPLAHGNLRERKPLCCKSDTFLQI